MIFDPNAFSNIWVFFQSYITDSTQKFNVFLLIFLIKLWVLMYFTISYQPHNIINGSVAN